MNIAIIGCGYVGTAVATHWHGDCGHYITATTTTKERVTELEQVAQQVVVMRGEDKSALQAVIQNQDAILLSIAPTGRRPVDPQIYKETYLDTAKNLVWALQYAPSVKQLIYTGSYSVYGNTDGAWVDEESLVTPGNKKSEVLHDTEQVLLQATRENLRVCLLRLGGIYGPERKLVKIFGRLAGTTFAGDGEYFTNWVHLDDIVSAIAFILLSRLEGIYNLVDDVPWITRHLVERVCEVHGLPPVSWDASPSNLRSGSVRVSNHKIKAAGYQFIHPALLI